MSEDYYEDGQIYIPLDFRKPHERTICFADPTYSKPYVPLEFKLEMDLDAQVDGWDFLAPAERNGVNTTCGGFALSYK